ncbi:hypothetical protein DSM21852_28690 [Methylocystis bryophila]|nr:hypothetical protein DSM21852_28690 [Methylocystis bryophila]
MPPPNGFWLFFDIKKGCSSLYDVHEMDLHWFTQRIGAAGISSEEWNHAGYGSNVVNLLEQDHRGLSGLATEINKPEWLSVFGGVFEELSWFFAASEGIRT